MGTVVTTTPPSSPRTTWSSRSAATQRSTEGTSGLGSYASNASAAPDAASSDQTRPRARVSSGDIPRSQSPAAMSATGQASSSSGIHTLWQQNCLTDASAPPAAETRSMPAQHAVVGLNQPRFLSAETTQGNAGRNGARSTNVPSAPRLSHQGLSGWWRG